MSKESLSMLALISAVVVFILMLTGSYLLRYFRKVHKQVSDHAEQKAKQYRDETGRQRQQYNQRPQQQYASPHTAQPGAGETVIDHRHTKRDGKKIFADSDGEYVEFTEEV